MTYIAHRHSWKSVHRFVPVLFQLVDHHKHKGTATISFNPTEMSISIETAVARLRDAAFSLSRGLTSHALIDPAYLAEVWPLYKVTSDGTNVLITPRTSEQEEPVTIHTGSGDSLATLKVEDAQFVEVVSAFALLLGQRYLQGQVVIQGDMSLTLRHQLESANDIVIVQDGPKQFHML